MLVPLKGLNSQLFYTFFKSPYVDTEMADEQESNRYISSKFYIEMDNHKQECHDLGCSVIKQTITLGLPSSAFWENLYFLIQETTDGTFIANHNAICITRNEHINENGICSWIDQFFHDVPIQTYLDPAQKLIHIRHDHGQDKLEKFARKLCNSPYIIKIINSLEWRPSEAEFISEVYPDGKIELRLHWTDKGLGLVILTTGKNIYQTRNIAKILKDEYDERT